MFQEEVAERLLAKPGTRTYGRLSVLIQYCARIYPLAHVAASSFFPRPKVDSEVVGIEFYNPDPFRVLDEQLLSRVIKAAFGKRRKTLKNALLTSDLGLDSKTVLAVLSAGRIDPQRRAETLSVEEFVTLSNLILKLGASPHLEYWNDGTME